MVVMIGIERSGGTKSLSHLAFPFTRPDLRLFRIPVPFLRLQQPRKTTWVSGLRASDGDLTDQFYPIVRGGNDGFPVNKIIQNISFKNVKVNFDKFSLEIMVFPKSGWITDSLGVLRLARKIAGRRELSGLGGLADQSYPRKQGKTGPRETRKYYRK